MKKSDLILLTSIALISLIAYFVLQITLNNSGLTDGKAVVVFEDERILEISLEDGSYKILDDSIGIMVDEENFLYTIPDTNGSHDLVIEYKDNKVRVKEEVSPQNVCSIQGWSNSPLEPLTCLPNSLVVIIEKNEFDPSLPDGTTK